MKFINILLFLLAAAFAAGCGGVPGNPEEREVKDGVEWALRTIGKTRNNVIAAESLRSVLQGGGSAAGYLGANLPEGAKFTSYATGSPVRTYCVYVNPGKAPGEFLVEGYGASLNKPIASGVVIAGPENAPISGAPSSPPETEAVGAAHTPAADLAVIESVHMQWIVSDSVPKVEVVLLGHNLSYNAVVTSDSPNLTVERLDPDPARTAVIVSMSQGTPPGVYQLVYTAPGQEPIPFSINYAAQR